MNIKGDTIARTIILAVALINQVCAVLGYAPLELEEETVYQICSLIATIGASLWSFWKNNSFTKAAIKADQVLSELK